MCGQGLILLESIQVYLIISFEGYIRLAHVVITSWRTGVFIESAGSAFMKSWEDATAGREIQHPFKTLKFFFFHLKMCFHESVDYWPP